MAMARELRDRFATEIAELRALVDEARPSWATVCVEEGWSVGATLAHLTASFERQLRWLAGLLDEGRLADFDWEETDARNAQNVERLTAMTPDEVRSALDAASCALDARLAALAEGDLDRPAMRYQGRERSLSWFVRAFLIGHAPMHLPNIRRAITGARPADQQSAIG